MKEAGLWTFFILALVIVGWSAWQISTTATPDYPGSAPGSVDDLPHQLTVEAGQAQSIALAETQVSLGLTQIAVTNPSPSPKPTKRPSPTPKPYVNDSCSVAEVGAECRLEVWTPTPAKPTPTLAPCYMTTPEQYNRVRCMNDPTPWSPLP